MLRPISISDLRGTEATGGRKALEGWRNLLQRIKGEDALAHGDTTK